MITFDGEFPADVANVDNRDTDGDGVLDLHDNSVAIWNPDQLDADGDGVGAASDCNDANAAVYGNGITPRRIFAGQVSNVPNVVVDFRDRLEEYTAH